MAVNAPELRWSKTRNTKLKVFPTRSVTEIFRLPVISKRNDKRPLKLSIMIGLKILQHVFN